MLVRESLLFEARQLAQRHPEDRIGLHARQRVNIARTSLQLKIGKTSIAQRSLHHRGRTFNTHQLDFRFSLSAALSNEHDDLVDVCQGQQQPFDNVLALSRRSQQELGSASNHGHAMPDKLLNEFFDAQFAWLAIHQRKHVDGERLLQGRELIELIENNVRIRILLDLDDDSNRFLQIAFIANRRDTLDLFASNEIRNPFDDPIAKLLIGNLADNQPRFFAFFDVDASPHDDGRPARVVTLANRIATADDSAGWEVRSRNDFIDFRDRNVRVVNDSDDRRAYFA